MYAIVRIGNRQYRAEAGTTLEVEKLPYEVGEKVTFDDVLLLVDGDNVQIGQPGVPGASVTATVSEQYRGKKIVVFKYNQRTNYRRKYGHRQYYTRLTIDDVLSGSNGSGNQPATEAAPAEDDSTETESTDE